MALDWTVTYAGKVATDATNYPYGKARNVTVSGDGTGTPWDEDLINDWNGFFQRLLVEASITPSGVSDTVISSDYWDAFEALVSGSILAAATETTAGVVELATLFEVVVGTDTTRAVTPAGLQAKAASVIETGGTSQTKFVTPLGLNSLQATEAAKGLVELATVAEATAGTDTSRAVTPAGLAAAAGVTGPAILLAPYLQPGWTDNGSFAVPVYKGAAVVAVDFYLDFLAAAGPVNGVDTIFSLNDSGVLQSLGFYMGYTHGFSVLDYGGLLRRQIVISPSTPTTILINNSATAEAFNIQAQTRVYARNNL